MKAVDVNKLNELLAISDQLGINKHAYNRLLREVNSKQKELYDLEKEVKQKLRTL